MECGIIKAIFVILFRLRTKKNKKTNGMHVN